MLNGWKTIATYLRRDERTVMRWAADRELPVHRVPGPGRGSVYALPDEIDAWLAANRAPGRRSAAIAPDVETMNSSGVEPSIDQPGADRPAANPTNATPPQSRRSWRLSRRSWIIATVVVGSVAVLSLAYPRHDTAAAEQRFTDPAAKALFLQAAYDWNLRTRDSLDRAAHEYAEAIGHDPRVPAAYVGLANTYLLLREYGSLPDAAAYPRAEAAARAAVALAPGSPEGHRALAFIAFWWRQDRAAARREFARSIALKPDDPLTHHWLANALLANGEAGAALREIDRARDLDPTGVAVLVDRGMILYVAGRRAEGRGTLRTMAREQPGAVGPYRSLAAIALLEGRGDEFLSDATTAAQLRGDATESANVSRWRAAAASGEPITAVLLNDTQRHRDSWFHLAQVAALAGHGGTAKDALARACDAHEPAAFAARTDLWLSRALTSDDIAAVCGPAASLT